MFGKNKKKINKKKIRKAIPTISEITGIAAGTLTAYFLKSSSAGTAAGGFIQPVLADFLNRVLSPMQEHRVLTVSAFAVDFIEKRLKDGEQLRDDGFFSEGTITRSDAQEVVDSMLFTVEDDPQEQKIPYMAHLIENGCFDASIHPDLLHFLYKESKSLTYRQLCIIKMIIENKHPLSLKSTVETPWLTTDRVPLLSEDAFPTLVECVNLGHRGYIDFKLSPPDDTRSGPVALLVPHSMRTRVPAGQMYGRMGLADIPKSDVLPIAKSLAATKVQS